MTAPRGKGPSRTAAAAFFAAILLLAANAPRSMAAAAPDPAVALLAERSWFLSEPPRILHPSNLYEEIDGEAELFLPYGFLELTAAYLHPAGRPGAGLRLELFRLGSPRDAYGVYSQFRFPGQETTAIGPSEAIVSDASLDFFRGDRLVRIRRASPSPTREDILGLARALSELLKGTGAPPAETDALRIRSLRQETVVYQKRAILGYDALAPGYEAKISGDGFSGTVLLLPGDPDPPGTRVRKLEDALPGFVRTGDGRYRADLPAGTLWLQEAGGSVSGVAGRMTPEQAGSVLEEIRRNLRTKAE